MTEKMIATIAVGAVAGILAASLGGRFAFTGEASSEIVTLLATIVGVLLGVRGLNGAAKRINGGGKN